MPPDLCSFLTFTLTTLPQIGDYMIYATWVAALRFNAVPVSIIQTHPLSSMNATLALVTIDQTLTPDLDRTVTYTTNSALSPPSPSNVTLGYQFLYQVSLLASSRYDILVSNANANSNVVVDVSLAVLCSFFLLLPP